MQNPYSTPNDSPFKPVLLSTSALARRAGVWLCVTGAIHLLLMNSLPASIPQEATNWSACWLVLIGIGVYFEIGVAEIIARILGTFTIIGCVGFVIIACAGLANEGTLTYGRYSTQSPHWWQVVLVVLGIAGTLGPPWYMLQIKLWPERAGKKRIPAQ